MNSSRRIVVSIHETVTTNPQDQTCSSSGDWVQYQVLPADTCLSVGNLSAVKLLDMNDTARGYMAVYYNDSITCSTGSYNFSRGAQFEPYRCSAWTPLNYSDGRWLGFMNDSGWANVFAGSNQSVYGGGFGEIRPSNSSRYQYDMRSTVLISSTTVNSATTSTSSQADSGWRTTVILAIAVGVLGVVLFLCFLLASCGIVQSLCNRAQKYLVKSSGGSREGTSSRQALDNASVSSDGFEEDEEEVDVEVSALFAGRTPMTTSGSQPPQQFQFNALHSASPVSRASPPPPPIVAGSSSA